MKFHQTVEQDPVSARPQKRLPNRPILIAAISILVLLAFAGGILIDRTGILGKIRLQTDSAIQSVSSTVDKNISDEMRLYQNNGLPTLFIDLKFKYYRQMLEKRDEALKVGILQTTDADFVPATITLNNDPAMTAEIRLKGDWTDHLEGDKWSFRIHLKNDGQVLGFRQFSIQTPETRNYLQEWAFHQNLIEENILTTRYHFINVLLNGKLLGIYGIEENFAGELIESQGRRQGVIIRFDEENLWDKWAYFFSQWHKIHGRRLDLHHRKISRYLQFSGRKDRERPGSDCRS